MDFLKLEEFLQKYQLIITILLIPILGIIYTLIKSLYNHCIEKQKEISISYTADESIENPNYCITSIEILNGKNRKLIGNKIELVVYDDKNEYCLELYKDRFIIEPEDVLKFNIPKVSHYICNNEIIDYKFLMFAQRCYFNMYNNNKLIFTNRTVNCVFKKLKHFQIKPFTATFEGIVHSFDWDYGFTYKDKITDKLFIGFMNKRQIYCRHLASEILDNDYFTPEILKNLIDSYGGKDIQIKKLSNSNGNYRHTTPVRLGEAYIKQNQNIEHKPIIITDNEILNFKVNNNS